jgi:hypothetical protein
MTQEQQTQNLNALTDGFEAAIDLLTPPQQAELLNLYYDDLGSTDGVYNCLDNDDVAELVKQYGIVAVYGAIYDRGEQVCWMLSTDDGMKPITPYKLLLAESEEIASRILLYPKEYAKFASLLSGTLCNIFGIRP